MEHSRGVSQAFSGLDAGALFLEWHSGSSGTGKRRGNATVSATVGGRAADGQRKPLHSREYGVIPIKLHVLPSITPYH